MVVLAQLALRNSYHVKFTLDFPSAPSGTIDHTILHANHDAKDSGTTSLTFSGAATSELHAAHNLGGVRVRMLRDTYQAIVKDLKLMQKSDFRQKLGGEEEHIYVYYPPHRLGLTSERLLWGSSNWIIDRWFFTSFIEVF